MDAPLRSPATVDHQRRKWAPYDRCGECNAIAGNPCRNQQRSSWPGGTTVRNKPHPSRPLKEVPDAT